MNNLSEIMTNSTGKKCVVVLCVCCLLCSCCMREVVVVEWYLFTPLTYPNIRVREVNIGRTAIQANAVKVRRRFWKFVPGNSGTARQQWTTILPICEADEHSKSNRIFRSRWNCILWPYVKAGKPKFPCSAYRDPQTSLRWTLSRSNK